MSITDLSYLFSISYDDLKVGKEPDNVQRMGSRKNLTLSLLEYCDGAITLSGQHEDILLVRKNGTIERIDTVELGLPIGLDDDIEHFISEMNIHINPGDGLVLYTDGVTEAENIDGEQYQIDRLCEVIQAHWQKPSEDIVRIIIEDLQKYIGKQTVYDDITLIVIKQKEFEEMQLVS